MIRLWSTNCPKCNVLKKKLEQAGKEYELIEDLDKVNEFAEKHDLHSAPILEVDDQLYDFVQANRIIKEL